MTTYVQARDWIVAKASAAFAANHPTLPVFWDNALEIDPDATGSPFVRVTIEFDDARQLTINGVPERRVDGEIVFSIFTKKGSGTRTTLALVDFLETEFKYVTTGPVKTSTPYLAPKDDRGGWVNQDVLVPFFFDSLT